MTRMDIGNQKGFSLIEALVAMVLLSVGLLAAGLLQIGGIKANANAAGRTFGVGLAQSIMDDLRSQPIDDEGLLADTGDRGNDLDDGRATSGGNPVPDDADQKMGSTGQVTGSDGRTYTVFWNVAKDKPVAGTKTVRLFVYWNDSQFGLNKVVTTTVLGGFY
jgi:type IV pilus assembly protein PilV